MDARHETPLGIAAIGLHQPPWELENSWFGESMPRKFTHHTGIEARGISLDDEMTMGLHAVRQLQRETGCNLADCRGLVAHRTQPVEVESPAMAGKSLS